ncbi:MAG: FAD-dependent oxidoreductase [archaeon]
MERKKIYDCVIVGGGPGGLTAGIYAGRYNLKTLIIAKSFGGVANLAGEVENWPGYVGPGIDLMRTFRNQAEKFGAEMIEGEISKVDKIKSSFEIFVGDKKYFGRTLIVALGTEHRQLNISGEKKFLGKGVSYCATCDGNFFRGKKVAVIGGADSAAKATIYLSDICKEVNVIYRKDEMRCEPIVLKKINKRENVKIYYGAEPIEILGEKVVKGLKIKKVDSDGEKEIILDLDGVFIEIGATPVSEVVKDLEIKRDSEFIVTNEKMATNVEGVYAVGDVRKSPMKQIITSASDGAIAAKSVHEFLTEKE